MTLDLIVDLNLGNKSVTNDIENVLRKIEAWHQSSIAGRVGTGRQICARTDHSRRATAVAGSDVVIELGVWDTGYDP